jgi:hypothetical protein
MSRHIGKHFFGADYAGILIPVLQGIQNTEIR